MAEALENTRHLLAAGMRPPLIVGLGDFSSRINILDKVDFPKNVLFGDGRIVVGHETSTRSGVVRATPRSGLLLFVGAWNVMDTQ
jgi:hypothetical protein